MHIHFRNHTATRDITGWLGPAVLALLFCLMLPIQALTHFERAPGWLAVPVFLLAFAVLFGLWRVIRAALPKAEAAQPRAMRWQVVVLYALPCLLVWAVFLYAFWPGILSSDSFDQWAQAHGLTQLNDWHPVAHTMLIGLLARIWDSPAVVAIFQALSTALIWGAGMAFFEARGIRRRVLLPLTLVFALMPYNGILLVTLWKDVLYTTANLLLVLLLGIIWYTRGAWLDQPWHLAAFGAATALPYLMRHNGLLLLAAVPLGLLVFYPRRWKPVMIAAGLAVALVLLVRSLLAFGVFNARPNPVSTFYEVPMHLIQAGVHYGIQVTPEQQALLEKFAPLTIWKNAFVPYNADTMTKSWGAMKDNAVYDKIAANQAGILRTLTSFALRHPSVLVKAELDLTSVVWEITEPPGYREYQMNYITASVYNPPEPPAALIDNPQAGAPVNRALIQGLSLSSTPLASIFFWRGGLYLFLTLFFGAVLIFERGKDAAILLIPCAMNVLSLLISIPGENFRYVYPYALTLFLIALFAFVRRPENQVELLI